MTDDNDDVERETVPSSEVPDEINNFLMSLMHILYMLMSRYRTTEIVFAADEVTVAREDIEALANSGVQPVVTVFAPDGSAHLVRGDVFKASLKDEGDQSPLH